MTKINSAERQCLVLLNRYQCRHKCQTLMADENERETWMNLANCHNKKQRLSTAVANVKNLIAAD